MAISTYSELKTAVARWVSRQNQAGFSDRVPEFIALAESFINNVLPLRVNIVIEPLTATLSSRSIALPSDFFAAYSLRITTDQPFEILTPASAGDIPYTDQAGRPAYWAVDETTIIFDCPCDQAYTFDFRYRKKFALSDASPTNWLLTNCPDVYLYGALYEAGAFIDDGSNFEAKMKARRDEAVALAKQMAARSLAPATLRSDDALMAIGKRSAFYPTVTF